MKLLNFYMVFVKLFGDLLVKVTILLTVEHRWANYHMVLCYGKKHTMYLKKNDGMVCFSYHGFRVIMDHMVPSYHD